ncbi:glycosyltransferase family 4 protein [soil metagenome]
MSTGLEGQRVLFVNENLGGHATMHHHLRAALARRTELRAEVFDVPAAGLGRRIVGASVPGVARLDADLQPLRFQLAAASVVRRELLARRGTYDVLHLYSQNAALLVTPQLRAVPSVVSTDCSNVQNAYALPQRSPGPFTAHTLALTRRFEDRVFASATQVVAQSEWAAASLRGDYGIDDVQVIPFGIVLPPPPRHRPQDVPEITFVGTSLARKGGLLLLEVFREHLRGRAVLNLVTRDHVPAEDGVRVHDDFVPGDARLPDLLARTAVFALPSDADKSSYAIVEALAAGVPVVTTSYGAQPEMVPDGSCGFIVAPGDGRALHEALARLLDDPALATRMGVAARARAEERFDAHRTTGALLDTLARAIDRHLSGRQPFR